MTHPYLNNWTCAVALVFLGLSADSVAQSLFESHDVLEVRIEAPLTTLVRVRSDVDYLDGTFSYTDDVGESQSFDLKLRARGRFRRKKSTCNFPPIRLNFKTGQVEGSVFDGEDKLKLVTHCKRRGSKPEQYLLREYMAYRILQILTDKSFRARLFHVTYVNNEKKDESMTKYAFVIEDHDNASRRFGLEPLEVKSLNYSGLDASQTNLINLFQYLIGNTDYSVIRGPADDDCCHNSVPFSDGEVAYPVPYDFDFAGLVDAPYADPSEALNLRDVRTRLYRGRCGNGDKLPESIAHMVSKKAEIYALLDEISYFDKSSRQSITRYLNSFFKDITDEKLMVRKLVKKCS